MRGRYFKTILILIVMYVQVMQAMLILAKSITGHIRFMISGDPGYGKAENKHMCSIWVCVSIFHNNDYGSSRRSSHTKHSDTRKEFAREAQTFGITELVYVPTEEQLADAMTKALPYPTFLAICLNNYLYYYEFSPHWS